MKILRAINGLRWPVRIPLKVMIFVLTVIVVCFPHLGLLVTHVERWRNPNALIEPDAPALQPWFAELRPKLPADTDPARALPIVQNFVYSKIRYKYDWQNWGNADYIPTVAETVAAGYEDCDGQAVVAASLLRKLGYEAVLVTDWVHVWVQTGQGDTMSPGGQKAIVAGDGGIIMQPQALAQLPRAIGFGLSVFFLHRELIIIGVLWLLLLRPVRSKWRNGAALAFWIIGLLLMRAGGASLSASVPLMQIGGLATMLGAVLLTSALLQLPPSRPGFGVTSQSSQAAS